MKPSIQFQIYFFCSILAVSFAVQKVQAEDTPPPREVQIGVSDVFVPGGFDSETDAYVVANGIFPNGCYRWKGADVSSVDKFNHEIRAKAMVSQGMCLMVLIPFTKEIRLGKLASGQHNLKFIGGDGTYLEKSLKVE